ncbi:MAG: DUF4387 family protein [Chloroflexi bacterium]|nr:DUF4387 family protein [Chloroflexota bacterium]
MAKLSDLAYMIRSRKVGQHGFEVDIIFKDSASYKMVVDSQILTKEVIARLYNTPESHVLAVESFDAGKTIHFVILRPGGRASGDPGETDVSGGLQYFPVTQLEVPV